MFVDLYSFWIKSITGTIYSNSNPYKDGTTSSEREYKEKPLSDPFTHSNAEFSFLKGIELSDQLPWEYSIDVKRFGMIKERGFKKYIFYSYLDNFTEAK